MSKLLVTTRPFGNKNDALKMLSDYMEDCFIYEGAVEPNKESIIVHVTGLQPEAIIAGTEPYDRKF